MKTPVGWFCLFYCDAETTSTTVMIIEQNERRTFMSITVLQYRTLNGKAN